MKSEEKQKIEKKGVKEKDDEKRCKMQRSRSELLGSKFKVF